MPKSIEKVKVSVAEEAKGEERIYTITVKAPASEFFLSDAFAARDLVPKLTVTLGESARKVAHDYISAADSYLRSTRPATDGNGSHHSAKTEAAGGR